MQTTEIQKTLPAEITGKFNLSLTLTKFQLLANKGNSLAITEDTVEDVKTFLAECRKVEKGIEAVHQEGKKEALEIGRNWDKAKNEFLKLVTDVTAPIAAKYSLLCQEITRKANEAAAEKLRISNIKTGIETNAVSFAKQIADATTTVQLSNIERNINLERTRKEKYQEFLPNAIERFAELNAILKSQKESIKIVEDLAAEALKAKQAGDDEKLIEIMEKQEVAAQVVEEKKITVQEVAINQSMSNSITEVEVIHTTVKPKRSVWRWEVKDIKETIKKMPDWTETKVIDSKIDEYLKAKRAEGIEGEEFNVAGIRFFIEKTY